VAYSFGMIKSYKNKGLERFATKGDASKLSVQNPARIQRILMALNAATQPSDLNLPGLRWHPLGKMAPGRYAVEASGNYRITFAWSGEDAIDVDLEDYH
jgi:proteic killer suppression protein